MPDWLTELLKDARIWQAIIAGAFISLGWFLTDWLKHRAALKDRQERRNDIRIAILTEIALHVDQFGQYDWNMLLEKADASFEEDHGYRPFVPMRQRDRVLQQVLGRIEVLEEDQIKPVMRYYNQMEEIRSFTMDIRSPEFVGLSVSRKKAIFLSLLEMERYSLDLGNEAIVALGGKRAEIRREDHPLGLIEADKTDRAKSGQAEASESS